MKDKKLIFASCLGLTLLALLFFVLLALAGAFNRSIIPPVSYPDTPDNIIDVEEEAKKEFNFAVITTEQTIELRNQINDKLIVSLERKNWKNLKWSPDNKNLAVLGESSEGIFDIYVYNLEQKGWTQVTDYTQSESGVTSFEWIDNENIYLKQGIGSQSWVHQLNIQSLANGIIKVVQMPGELHSVSPNGDNVVLKNGESFSLINLEGNVVATFVSLEVVNENTSTATASISELYFMDNGNILFQTSEGLAVGSRDQNSAVKLQNASGNIICTSQDQSIFSVLQEAREIKVSHLDLEDKIIAEAKIPVQREYTINPTSPICYNTDKILVGFTTNRDEWYVVEGNSATAVQYMDKVKEVSTKNNLLN